MLRHQLKHCWQLQHAARVAALARPALLQFCAPLPASFRPPLPTMRHLTYLLCQTAHVKIELYKMYAGGRASRRAVVLRCKPGVGKPW